MLLPLHAITDALAYSAGISAFFIADRKLGDSQRPVSQRLLLAVWAFLFGAIAAKAMPQFENGLPVDWPDFAAGFMSGGKTIMGGVLGG